ncbi:uncharacterized protein LOC113506518 [Trichoplusia ni]|uniref:Uncharacterized protein LOC113506518 n=1 Tax=Trichoplusia ni TaxID=7111 RepID=A0A7E5WXB6_TRINI|nr:uncharacterized protein LOC113506518 [Trichoplusia ni]
MWRGVLLLVFVTLVASAASVTVYSSFWAPLFDRRILNYRVDVAFDPQTARATRDQYTKDYGYRGERLIADLGNGKGPSDVPKNVEMYGDVTFYYT